MCTWVLVQDAVNFYNRSEDPKLKRFGGLLRRHWSFPMDFQFYDSSGEYVSKINSLDDFNTAKQSNQQILVAHIEDHFGSDAE